MEVLIKVIVKHDKTLLSSYFKFYW